MLGLTAAGGKEPMTDVLTRLLDQVAALGVTVRATLLDKAFFSTAMMQLLQSRNLPFVIPVVIRGRKPWPGVKAVGLRAIRNRGAGQYGYTHEDRGKSVRVARVQKLLDYRKLTGTQWHLKPLMRKAVAVFEARDLAGVAAACDAIVDAIEGKPLSGVGQARAESGEA